MTFSDTIKKGSSRHKLSYSNLKNTPIEKGLKVCKQGESLLDFISVEENTQSQIETQEGPESFLSLMNLNYEQQMVFKK